MRRRGRTGVDILLTDRAFHGMGVQSHGRTTRDKGRYGLILRDTRHFSGNRDETVHRGLSASEGFSSSTRALFFEGSS